MRRSDYQQLLRVLEIIYNQETTDTEKVKHLKNSMQKNKPEHYKAYTINEINKKIEFYENQLRAIMGEEIYK